MNIKTILMNSLKGSNFSVMMQKVFKRFENNNYDEALVWAKNKVTTSTDEFCKRIDAKLFQDIKKEILDIELDASKKLNKIDVNLGGGGNYVLLYFLIRKFKLSIIVETGVAAGWTSLAILKALKKNGNGLLYSSDFPYFRLESPEKYVGFLVQEAHLKKRWYLDIRGDNICLPKIATLLNKQKIDLFHYDSDKSYSGRKFALEKLREKFSSSCIIIFDDIQDNLHFRDWVDTEGLDYTILEFQGKYVGIVGI